MEFSKKGMNRCKKAKSRPQTQKTTVKKKQKMLIKAFQLINPSPSKRKATKLKKTVTQHS